MQLKIIMKIGHVREESEILRRSGESGLSNIRRNIIVNSTFSFCFIFELNFTFKTAFTGAVPRSILDTPQIALKIAVSEHYGSCDFKKTNRNCLVLVIAIKSGVERVSEVVSYMV